MHVAVQCYLIQRGSEWEAVCVDFDLAARGNSFESAYQSLGRAIHEYVEYVETLPENERKRFYNRRAPLRTRLGFAVGAFLTALSSHRRDHGQARNVYTAPCAA